MDVSPATAAADADTSMAVDAPAATTDPVISGQHDPSAAHAPASEQQQQYSTLASAAAAQSADAPMDASASVTQAAVVSALNTLDRVPDDVMLEVSIYAGGRRLCCLVVD